MHTRDKLEGPLCKCMDCARQRSERLQIWIEDNRSADMAEVRRCQSKARSLREEADREDSAAREIHAGLRQDALAAHGEKEI